MWTHKKTRFRRGWLIPWGENEPHLVGVLVRQVLQALQLPFRFVDHGRRQPERILQRLRRLLVRRNVVRAVRGRLLYLRNMFIVPGLLLTTAFMLNSFLCTSSWL